MNVLLTGASGFIGSSLVGYLKNTAPNLRYFRLAKTIPSATPSEFDATISWSDLSTEWLDQNHIHAVVHLAGLAHAEVGLYSEEDYERVNFKLTKDIYDAFLDSREGKKFIFMSTVKAVRDQLGEEVLTETTKPEPTTPYGVAKLKAEQYISSNKRSGKEVYILRPCMVYGPGNKGNMDLLVGLLSKDIPFPLGAFQNQRSFLYIENLCFAFRYILESKVDPGVYNLADPNAISTVDLVTYLKNCLRSSSPIWKVPKPFIRLLAAVGDVLPIPLNSSRLEKLTENYPVDSSLIARQWGSPWPFTTEQGIKKTFGR